VHSNRVVILYTAAPQRLVDLTMTACVAVEGDMNGDVLACSMVGALLTRGRSQQINTLAIKLQQLDGDTDELRE
jgi:hypothetical protein